MGAAAGLETNGSPLPVVGVVSLATARRCAEEVRELTSAPTPATSVASARIRMRASGGGVGPASVPTGRPGWPRHFCDDRLRAESLRRCTRCHVAFAPLSPIWNRRTLVPTATTSVTTMSRDSQG